MEYIVGVYPRSISPEHIVRVYPCNISLTVTLETYLPPVTVISDVTYTAGAFCVSCREICPACIYNGRK